MHRSGFVAVSVLTCFVSSSCTEFITEGPASADVDAGQKKAVFVAKSSWGKHKSKLEYLHRQLQKDACNKQHALDFAEKLNNVREYEMAIEAVDAHVEKCGEWTRILWPKSVALRYLKRFSEGAPVVTKLIVADKVDSDYWWWRGRHYAQAKDNDRAEADFRQSSANKPSGWGSGKMSGFLGDERPCPAAFLISRYMEKTSRKVGDWAAPARTKHWVAGDCDKFAGTGRTTLKWKKGIPVRKADAKIAKKPAKLIVDDKAGYVVVSSAFAKAAGLEPGPEVEALGVGQMLTGRVATADMQVGNAKAKAVPVLVVTEVPGGVDGILGQSFFIRFKISEKPTSMRISAR